MAKFEKGGGTSRRKKQAKEKRDDEDEEEEEEEEEEENEPKRKSSSSSSSSSAAEKDTDDRVWVQCNTCDKWRALPSTVDPAKLPDIWYCELNVYDSERNTCEAPEESYNEGVDEPLKSFVKLYAKKLKTADKAETRLSSAAMTRGRKRKAEVEWIRCCNPACGKWRAVVRTIETQHVLSRLSKGNRWGSKGTKWYCAMNSWDETQASCAAPQEPLYDCRWNLAASSSSSSSSSSS